MNHHISKLNVAYFACLASSHMWFFIYLIIWFFLLSFYNLFTFMLFQTCVTFKDILKNVSTVFVHSVGNTGPLLIFIVKKKKLHIHTYFETMWIVKNAIQINLPWLHLTSGLENEWMDNWNIFLNIFSCVLHSKQRFGKTWLWINYDKMFIFELK